MNNSDSDSDSGSDNNNNDNDNDNNNNNPTLFSRNYINYLINGRGSAYLLFCNRTPKHYQSEIKLAKQQKDEKENQ